MSNDLLSAYQFGFLKERSTTLQLLKILNDWTESMESKFSTDCIYLDYQKAFDSVPHRRLISKLRSYKINESLVRWVKNYLQDRSQFVEINIWGKISMDTGHKWHSTGKCIRTPAIFNLHKRLARKCKFNSIHVCR